MIERDRQLLADAATTNRQLGADVLDLVTDPAYDGQLPARRLRDIGDHLQRLAAEFLARAAELDDDGTNAPTVVDARP